MSFSNFRGTGVKRLKKSRPSTSPVNTGKPPVAADPGISESDHSGKLLSGGPPVTHLSSQTPVFLWLVVGLSFLAAI